MSKTTISINGRLYDAVTGMPVADAINQPKPEHRAPTHHQSHQSSQTHQPKSFSDFGVRQAAHTHVARTSTEKPAASVHQRPLKSQTLHRQAIKKPEVAHTVEHIAQTTHRSPQISKFASPKIEPVQQMHVEPPVEPPKMPAPDHLIPPQTTPFHPALARQAASTASSYRSSKELKEHLIRERLAEVSTHKTKAKKQSLFARKPKLASILASTLSLLILGGYFTYINLSNISMQVASTRAGVSAEFPNYKPSGYDISGPITYAPGEVSINYKSNVGDAGFTLTQKAANWDSQAVLDNYVRKQSNTYLTFQDHGITVYTFNNKAAWSNGGMLYTIDGNANLSSEQVLRLATSI
ncbi:MAG TPA: hypothetical protein VLA77_04385 [Candidatus Saccharimonadales bacterium]|nr:hypothetical protein [Candidatus Saccharimonadales bacterium]